MNKIKCLICSYECGNNYLGTHTLQKHNISAHEYYDFYLKKEKEENCVICNKTTKYRGIIDGYNITCSRQCAHKYRQRELQEKYGVVNQFQLEEVKQKSKKTIIEKYNTDNISKTEYAKNKKAETCLNNFGVRCPFQSEELKKVSINTIREKYGDPSVNNIGQVKQIKDKIKNTKKIKYDNEYYTNRKKADETIKNTYGVTNAMFVKEIADKAAFNGGGKATVKKYITQFGDEILIQGTYEEKFVNFCEEKGFRIINGPTISYEFEGKQRNYRVDFQVFKQDEKILVEIKSSYWYNKLRDQVEIKAKYATEYCSQNNMSYQILIDKWSLE